MSDKHSFAFQTGTATLAIFDLAAMQHRLTDTADWWSIAEDELQEINAGNIIFVGLGADGCYEVAVTTRQTSADCLLYLAVPSGSVFIGAAEDTTADGLEPDQSVNTSGKIIDLAPGYYQVSICRNEQQLNITFTASTVRHNNLLTPVVML